MDSNKIAQIADVMEDRGLTRVRVEEPDGSAFELERAVEQAPVPAVVVPQVVAADAAVAACKARVDSQIESCTDYAPAAIPGLENAVILQRGCTVLFAVGDPDKLPQALSDLALSNLTR